MALNQHEPEPALAELRRNFVAALAMLTAIVAGTAIVHLVLS
jgi:hypothetical protein